MQYSFIAIIEAWLSGVLFMITTALLLFRIYWGISDVKISWDIIINFSPIITILLCSLAYSIGWIVNHIAESIFDPLLQHRFRAELEKENKVNFFKVRAYVFQYGSDQTLNDIKYDRQVIRIARANCFNFFIMALVMLSYLVINQSSRIIPLFFFSFVSLHLAVLSSNGKVDMKLHTENSTKYILLYPKVYPTSLTNEKYRNRTTIHHSSATSSD